MTPNNKAQATSESKTKLTSVRNGVETTSKTNDEMLAEERKVAEHTQDLVKQKMLDDQKVAERETYKLFLHKTIDLYDKKINQAKIDLMNAKTKKEQEDILATVRAMAAFQKSLSSELDWLRIH